MKCFIITGLSGSGKTTALKAFEDLGYYCIDNLPTVLVPQTIEILALKTDITNIAIGIDIREKIFIYEFENVFELLTKKYDFVKIIFLYANDNVIINRFKETRRKHPLKNLSILEALREEKKILENIKSKAEFLIDTTFFNVHELKKFIFENFSEPNLEIFNVNIISFGYKNGILLDGDLIFDVRFLPNPYFVEHLKEKDGYNEEVSNYIFSFEKTKQFYEKLIDFLHFLLPEYKAEGKNIVIVGIGCTGGKHRSVAIANKLYNDLKEKYSVTLKHRDL